MSAASLLVLLRGCDSGDPFSYVPSSGTVIYDDGSPIPAAGVRLAFIPVNPPDSGDPKVSAQNGKADVDNLRTGAFSIATSRTSGDGMLPGKNKVVEIARNDRGRPVDGFVPPEYMDPRTTPLTVDTAQQPFVIKIKKPPGGVKPMASGDGTGR